MKNAKLIAAAIGAIVIVVVIMQNTATVDTHFLFFTVSMPRAVLLMATLLIGFALGVLVTTRMTTRKRI